MAYLLIRGSDQAKYGTFKKWPQYQFYLDNDQYSKTIMATIDVLNKHKFDMK